MKAKLLFTLCLLVSSAVRSQGIIQKLKALPDIRRTSQYYGNTVAINGNFAIAGTYGESRNVNDSDFKSNAGAAYIFEKDANGNWSFKQKLVASDRAVQDAFAWSVAISGNYAIVGAFQESEDANGSNTLANAGSAYIFERNSSGVWVEVQKIVASDRGADDLFGITVAISGNYALVGAEGEDHNATGGAPLADAGSAYFFERNGSGVWQEVKKVVAFDRAAGDNFGTMVSISGNTAVIGADQEDHDASGANARANAGSVYVFERVGGSWVSAAKLVASDRDVDDYFGSSLAIDGTYLIVGARIEDHDVAGMNAMTNSGAAYLFEKKSGTWTQVQKIVSGDRESFGWFGEVSISGKYALVGSYGESQDATGGNVFSRAGAAYLFERNDNTGVWQQIEKFVSGHRGVDYNFGQAVGISGPNMILGCPGDFLDANGGDLKNNSGATYIFTFCKPDHTNVNANGCRMYQAPSGKQFTSSGNYLDTLSNSNGCDSILHISLSITQIDTSVTKLNASLTANEDFAVLQWLDCDNNYTPIPNAISKTFVATKNGNYAVAYNKNNCLDTSACFRIDHLDLNSLSLKLQLKLHPNPSGGIFYFSHDLGYSISQITVFDISGQFVKEVSAEEFSSSSIDLSDLKPGYYMIEFIIEDTPVYFKCMKN